MSAQQSAPDLWEEGLTRLFQAGLELALKVQEDAMAAESPMERAQLASAFHRIARSVRQTAAMKGRLERDALDIARRREAKAAEIAKAPLTARKAQVCARIGNLAYAEIDDDAEFHQLELDAVERLEREALFEGFLDEPLEAQVDRIARALGLTPPADPPPRTEGSPSPLAGEGAPRLPDG